MRARVLDAAGAQVAVDQRVLGRVLVDDSGKEAPFWRATKVGSDTRVQVGGSWTDTLALATGNAGTVEVDIVYRGMSEAVAKELGRTPAQVALNWVFRRPGVCSVLIGATTIEQLDENLSALDFELPASAERLLEERSTVDPGMPYVYFQPPLRGRFSGGTWARTRRR